MTRCINCSVLIVEFGEYCHGCYDEQLAVKKQYGDKCAFCGNDKLPRSYYITYGKWFCSKQHYYDWKYKRSGGLSFAG